MSRPKVAVREEYRELKRRLGECHKYEWQKAQGIYDRIVELTGSTGPGGARQVPRACKACGYYGHTAQYCKVQAAREALALKKENDYFKPVKQEECTPEQWAWVQTFRAISARHLEGYSKGMGCRVPGPPVHCAEDVDWECQCEGCKEWVAFMSARC